MLELLGRVSHDTRTLVRMGNIERLRELFAREPELAKVVNDDGSLLFWLPDDEDCAAEVTEFLLAQGIDPLLKNRDGSTAAECAERQGLVAAPELLRSSTRKQLSR
jgi:ankyrin repeat protein